MNPKNKRIALNVVATYGRSLYSLLCGLFTARWVLGALGEVDYGLVGVVGGLTGFMSFFNGLLSAAVARFYAFSVGKAISEERGPSGIDECRRWFNVAVFSHTAIAALSVLVGYPIGLWAIRNFLTIPPDRLVACIWVFRLSCVSCFVAMASVPYQAMYTAKQEIAELTLYGFITTTLNVVFLCYMISHPADWLVRYSCWVTLIGVVPSLIISARSFVKYPECRIVPRYFIDRRRFFELGRYASLRLVSSVSILTSFQGITVLVNKMLGPARNAAMTVSNNVCSHALNLTSALNGAMAPAITQATGAGDTTRVRDLAQRTDVYASLAVAVFALPLGLEMNEILRIWLKTPPAETGVLCQLLLTAKFIDQMTVGEYLSIMSLRDIGRFQIFDSLAYLLPFPIAAVVFSLGGGLAGVGIGFVVLYTIDNVGKLYFARRQCGFPLRNWLRCVFLPVASMALVVLSVGIIPTLFFPSGFLRVVLTTLLVEVVIFGAAWTVLLRAEERDWVKNRFLRFFHETT